MGCGNLPIPDPNKPLWTARAPRLRCRIFGHDYRDKLGWPWPDWNATFRPRRYACSRCGARKVLNG